VLHVRLTELHAAYQNIILKMLAQGVVFPNKLQKLLTNFLPPAIRTLRVKEPIQNIHQKRTKSDNCGSYNYRRCVVSGMNSSIEVMYLLHIFSV